VDARSSATRSMSQVGGGSPPGRSVSFMRYHAIFLLLIALAGCTASKVYHQPLSDVSRAIDALQPQMVADVSPDCKKLGILSNQVTGKSYGIWVGEMWGGDLGGPCFSIQATNQGANETEVVVTRMTKGGSLGFTRRRDLERQAQDTLAKRLEIKQ